jgi:hypothetical protein
MMNLAPERAQIPSGVACAALKSAAPSPIGEKLRLSRRPCTASHALVGGGALLRVESLFAVALPHLDEKGGGKNGAGFSSPSHARPAARAEAGTKTSKSMRSLQKRSALDHRQVRGQDVRALQTSDSSRRAGVLLPEDRSLYCDGDDCGQMAR